MLKKEKVDPAALAEKSSFIYWLLMFFVTTFLFWSPFHKALFNGNTFDFERPVYSALVWSSIILLLVAIFFFSVWKWKTNKDALSIAVLLLPLTYLISLIPAASYYYASNMVYIQIMYATFFIIGANIAKYKHGNSILSSALLGSGYFIVFFGLLNWLGNGKFAGSLVSWFSDVTTVTGIYKDAVMTDSNGLRLTSVFQYANSYAAFLIALLFGALFLIVKSKKWYTVAINAFMLVPIIISFFLTLSRGAIVVIPVILLVILFFLQLHRQILFLIHMVLAFVASFAILQKITDAGIQLHQQFSGSISGQNWLLLLGVSLALALVIGLIQHYAAPYLDSKLERISERKWTHLAVPSAAILLGVLGAVLLFSNSGVTHILPENVKTRLENINFAQHSVLERGTFYKDAIKAFKDHPLLGAGGGAWSALYEKYQNNPYISRQAHNFFLQYLVEVGLVGIIVFLAFLGSVFYLYIRKFIRNKSESRDSHFLFFIIVISLLIHSIIDFDLSYVYLGILVFLSLGAMVSDSGDEPFRWNLDKPAINKLFPSLLGVLAIVMFFASARLLSANSSFQEAIKVTHSSNDYNAIMTPLNEALRLHPDHPNYLMATQAFPGKIGILLQVYNQNKDERFYAEAQTLLESLKEKEPYNRQVLAQEIYMLQVKGQLAQAAELAAARLSDFPWDITLYEEAVSLKVQSGLEAKNQNNLQAADSNWNDALEVYSKVLHNMKHLETLPEQQVQGRVFDVTVRIALGIGQVQYYKGNYAEAANLIKPHVSDQFDIPDNPPLAQSNRTIARWYLAALHKQNTNDDALYNKLIATDPNELQQIQAILSASSGVK